MPRTQENFQSVRDVLESVTPKPTAMTDPVDRLAELRTMAVSRMAEVQGKLFDYLESSPKISNDEVKAMYHEYLRWNLIAGVDLEFEIKTAKELFPKIIKKVGGNGIVDDDVLSSMLEGLNI